MKKILALVMLMFGMATTISAQENNSEFSATPYWFLNVQGGIQDTFNKDFNNWKTIKPTAALSIGRFFSPEVGARLNLNGIFNKGAAGSVLPNHPTDYYNYQYLTTSADVLVNLCYLFGGKEYYPLNVYFIGGLGWFHAWDNDEAVDLANRGYSIVSADKSPRNAFNGRLGLQLEYDITRNIAVNLESSFNMHAGQHQTFAKDDDQLLVLAGLNYKFGHKKIEEPVEEPVWETRIDTIWYNEDSYSDRVESGNIAWNVFYEIRESDYYDTDAYLTRIGSFLKDHRECKVSVKSYADAGTGNPTINMEYSRLRNEKAVKALTDAGVDANVIKAEYFGDTVQPFAENDKNRVTIITAIGLKDVKDKNTVRKFRTEETQVRTK